MRTAAILLLAYFWSLSAAASPPAETRLTFLYDAMGADERFERDWGFSVLIEHAGRRILVDTGNNPDVFARNALAANVDLGDIDAVILTHRHMDHLGGLPIVLQQAADVPIFAPQEAFGVFGSRLPTSFYRRSGRSDALPERLQYFGGSPDESMQFVSAWPQAKIETVAQTRELFPGVHLLFHRSEREGSMGIGELSLAIESADGLIVIVGCSHPGVETIVASAKQLDSRIAMVVGGFHLPAADDLTIQTTIDHLKALGVRTVAPAHCTGEPAIAAFRAHWADSFLEAGVGRTISTPRYLSRDTQRRRSTPAEFIDR